MNSPELDPWLKVIGEADVTHIDSGDQWMMLECWHQERSGELYTYPYTRLYAKIVRVSRLPSWFDPNSPRYGVK